MILVLHEDTDLVGPWISSGLSAMGETVLNLTESELSCAAWHCEVKDPKKNIRITVDGSNGKCEFTGHDLRGIINRVEHPGSRMVFCRNTTTERLTPEQLFAFHLGWLNRFNCPVFNQTPLQGSCIKRFHLSHWLMMAIQSGLETPALRWDPANSWTDSWQAYQETRLLADHRERKKLFVVGEYVFSQYGQPNAPTSVIQGCIHVSKLAQAPMIQLNFVIDDNGNWVFLDGNSRPEIHLAGDMGLSILSHTLKSYKETHYRH